MPVEYVEDKNGCWNCTSHKGTKGYPRMKLPSGKRRVALYMWCESKGIDINSLPLGTTTVSSCKNKMCINPEHLLVTDWENFVESQRKPESRKYTSYINKHVQGSSNGRSKLNEKIVWRIKFGDLNSESHRSLSRKYGVDPKAIRLIKQNINWKHITKNYFQKDKSISTTVHFNRDGSIEYS